MAQLFPYLPELSAVVSCELCFRLQNQCCFFCNRLHRILTSCWTRCDHRGAAGAVEDRNDRAAADRCEHARACGHWLHEVSPLLSALPVPSVLSLACSVILCERQPDVITDEPMSSLMNQSASIVRRLCVRSNRGRQNVASYLALDLVSDDFLTECALSFQHSDDVPSRSISRRTLHTLHRPQHTKSRMFRNRGWIGGMVRLISSRCCWTTT